jgi:DNA-binding LacI/PurR family transcriptional regulator
LRVASNDDHPFSRFTCPSLTTAAHDYDNVTSRTVETLVQLVESGGQLPSRTETLFPARLILGLSLKFFARKIYIDRAIILGYRPPNIQFRED